MRPCENEAMTEMHCHYEAISPKECLWHSRSNPKLKSLTFLITRGFNPLHLFTIAYKGLKPPCYLYRLLVSLAMTLFLFFNDEFFLIKLFTKN